MKKIGILGTGVVGTTIGTKLIWLDYEVMIGSRTASNEKSLSWVDKNGSSASAGTFEEAADFGEIIFNCTRGDAALEIFKQAGLNKFDNKTVIDISNPLDFSKGMPPTLIPEYVNTNSLAEEIQKLLPEANVVKTLNIVNCDVMVDPGLSNGEPTMFICGNNNDAKEEAKIFLYQFGWQDILDLGDIKNARAMEMILPLWVRTYGVTGNAHFAFRVMR